MQDQINTEKNRGDMEVLLVIYQVGEEPRDVVFLLITHSILATLAGLGQY